MEEILKKIDSELIEEFRRLHTIYASWAIATMNNAPPDSVSGFIGWLKRKKDEQQL